MSGAPQSLALRVALVPLVHAAFILAKRAHEGQVDKAGEPYVGHVVRVAEYIAATGAPDEAVMVALLHDVVEDTEITLEDLGQTFPDTVVAGVEAMTHRPNESRPDYRDRVRDNPLALLVKSEGDLRDNTDPRRPATGDPWNNLRRERKYAEDARSLRACGYGGHPEHDHDACVDALVIWATEYVTRSA